MLAPGNRLDLVVDLRGDSSELVAEPADRGGRMGGGGGPMSFTFGGQQFDAGRIDQQVRLGTVEEWTIGNNRPLDHPFHLHV